MKLPHHGCSLLALAALFVASPAHAHGDSFEMRSVSVSPQDPDEIWGVVENQGVVWTTDGGGAWSWICDSALGATRVYDVLALGEGRAAVATLGSVALVDADCGLSALAGVPEDAYADHLVAQGDALLAAVSGAAGGGIYRCEDSGCAPTELYEDGLFVKSILPVDGGFLASSVRSSDLSAELLRSTDGQRWSPVFAWPDGDVDPRVLYADGDLVLVWAIPRASTDQARLLRSTDGGASFDEVWVTDSYTTATGTIIPVGGGLLFGHNQGLTLWSEDGGQRWEERSNELPTVICGASLGDRGLICADHLYDGIDLATSEDGLTWTPIACLERASTASCAAEACAAARETYDTLAAIGGARCDELINPPTPAEEEGGCGCGGGGDSALLLLPALLIPRRRRGRRNPVP